MTLHEAEHLVASRLIEAGMYRDPQVTILVTESPNQVATVIGEMHGLIPIPGKKRLFDVLAGAGGFTQTASHRITILRAGVNQPIVVDMGNDPALSEAANIPVFSGDTVIVPRVGVVYVMGSVKLQSAFPLNPTTPLTLMQALALAGGYVFESKLDDARIIRTNGTERTMILVHLKKTLEGKEPDPFLQADDVVIIPTSTIRAAIKNGGIGTAIGLATSFVYFTTVNN